MAGFGAAEAAAGFSAGFAAAVSGLALACLAAAGLAAGFASDLASVFGEAAASGFFDATRDFLPRCGVACFSASTATAAIRTYKRNGFEIYGTDPRAIRLGDVTYDKYLMMKKFR